MNQHERNEYQRNKRKENGNAYTLKYERTESGKIMRIYRNMQSRVNGIQKAKAHLYSGKELLPRDEFYAWASENTVFSMLFLDWVNSGYDRKLSPSVDRIDSEKGYLIGNMEWVTHSENSRRGAISQIKNGKFKLQGKAR